VRSQKISIPTPRRGWQEDLKAKLFEGKCKKSLNFQRDLGGRGGDSNSSLRGVWIFS